MAEERKKREESLQAREYRDEQGNIHHHTKEYLQRHGRGSENRGGAEDGGRREEED